jgi:hypothetical protein
MHLRNTCETSAFSVRYEILTEVSVTITVYSVMTSYSEVHGYQHVDHSSSLAMDAVDSSEKLVRIYQSIRHQFPQG